MSDNSGSTQAPLTDDVTSSDDDSSSGDVFATVMSNVFLFFLIFGLSATVEIKNLRKQLTNKFAIGSGVAMQFIIMPLLGFVTVKALSENGMNEAMGITLLVVTSSPGGSYSNWWCSTFNADLALSVAMTTVSSLLSIGMLPANLLFYSFLVYGSDEEQSVVEALDFGTLFISLGIVMGAIVLGLACGYRWDHPRFHELANRLGSISGLCLILFGLFISSGADGAESSFWEHGWAFYVGVAFPCLVGIALANIISRSFKLSHPETVAISIECCYQNTGIATSVAITMFDDPEERAQAVAVPLFYGVVEAVVIGLYCVWAWKVGWTKAPADENFCTVVTKSYEVADIHNGNDDRHSDADPHEHHEPNGISTEAALQNEAVLEAMESESKREQATRDKSVWSTLRRLFGEDDVGNAGQTNDARQGSTKDIGVVSGKSRPEDEDEDFVVVQTTLSGTETSFQTPRTKADARRRMTSDFTAETTASSNPPLTPRTPQSKEVSQG